MKKRKILYFIPLAALLLSGCSWAEFKSSVKESWVGQHILNPIKNWISGGDSKKEETPTPEPDGGDDQKEEATVVSIKTVNAPEFTYVGEAPALSEYTLVLSMSDGTEKNAQPDKVDLDVSEAAVSVQGIAHYKTLQKKFFIEVREKGTPVTPQHAGTEADPFSGADAVLVASKLQESTSANDKHPSDESYYIKDVVTEVIEFGGSYGNFTFMLEGGFEGYRLKNGPERVNFKDEKDIEVGDTVTIYAQLLNFKGTYENEGGYVVSVVKPAIDAEVTEITIEGNPQTAYLAGDKYNHDGLTVVAHYDNGQTQNVTGAATWELSKETAEIGDETLTITAHYLTFDCSLEITITVQDGESPVHAGTEEDPYSGLDAVIVANKLTAGEATESSYYIKGVVESFEENFNPQYGNYSFKIDGGFIGWRLKNGSSQAAFNDGDLEIGDTVTMYAQIQAYIKNAGDTPKPETKGGYIVSIEKPAIDAEVTEITIEGNPQTAYLAGDKYNHDELTVVAHYDNGQTQNVTGAATWELSKETAVIGDETLTITAHYLTFDCSLEITITVQDGESPVHAGTAEDPYSGLDAVIVANKLEAGAATEQSYYIKGVVESFEESFNPQYGNYSFKIDGGFIGWRLKNGSSQVAFNEGDLEIGNTVTMYAQIQAYIKNAGDTPKPETKGGYIVEIVKETVLVSSVTVSPNVLALEKGKAGAQLSAEVLPENATDKSLIWSSANEEVATVSSAGLVTAVGEGTTTITATAKDGSGKSGSCEVTVTVPEIEVELTSIKITGELETSEYVEGTNYNPAGLVVTAYYSDETSEDITSSEELQWTMTPATATVGDEEVTFAASYKEQDDSVALPVTVSEAKGTLEHPYSVAEARAAIDAGEGLTDVYATGIVSEIVTPYNDGYHNVSFNISADGSKSADQLQGFRTVASSADDIEVGDTVVLHGTLKKFNSTYEFDAGNTVISNTKATVESVVISGTPSQTTYSEGSAYNHNGLVATAHLDVGLDIDVTELASWEPSKATAEEGDEAISFVATYKEVPSEAFEYAVEVTTDVVPTEKVVYTLDGTVTGGTSGYAEASEITQSEVVWSVEGNTTMNPWRIGGKSLSGVDRVAKSTQAVTSDNLSKVSVTTGTKTLSAVNSITIKVGSTEGASDLGSQTFTTDLVSTTLEFERPSNADWSNAFITVVFNVNAAGSNQYIQLIAINLYAVK